MVFFWKKDDYSRICLLCFIVLSLTLSGCGSYQTQTYKPTYIKPSQIARQSDSPHPSGYSERDISNTSLTRIERTILLRHSFIEQGLTKDQMKQVEHFYSTYLKNPRTLDIYLERSQPYLDYILTTLSEKNMPMELFSLAYVESGYDLKIRSKSNAVGLWQFIPSTGKEYGLTQDWHGDLRHDPYLSTQAATKYLEYLYSLFNDWQLAITSYNGGQGKIGRALKATNTDNLDALNKKNHTLNSNLRIKQETLDYFPRFIAMKKIMMNTNELGITANPSPLSSKIYTTLVPENTDFLALSEALNMPWNEFHAYNVALESYVSPPNKLVYIHVPAYKEQELKLALNSKLPSRGMHVYKVAKNDTFSKLSKQTGIPVAVLIEINSTSRLIAEQKILIPGKIGKTYPTTITRHFVNPNLNTTQLAQEEIPYTPSAQKTPTLPNTPTVDLTHAHTFTPVPENAQAISVQTQSTTQVVASPQTSASSQALKEIKQENTYTETAVITSSPVKKEEPAPSIQVKTPEVKPAPKPKEVAQAPQPSKTKARSHKVQKGDTLYSIAKNNNVSLQDIYAINKGLNPQSLKIGMVIALPEKPMLTAADMTQKYVVKSGDTVWSLSRKHNIDMATLLSVNNLPNAEALKSGQTILLP